MVPIAIAAAFQAFFVRWVLVRQNFLNDRLTRFSRLFMFLAWTGPLGNWAAALTFLLYQLRNPISTLDLYQTILGSLFWWIFGFIRFVEV